MNDQTEILDAPAQTEAPASSAEITISLDKVKGEVAAFDKINAGLAKLRKQHPSDLVVDVTTPAGMKLAITARAAYRDPRVALERARKSAKAPVLELGRSIDKFAAGIEEQLRIGESNYHDQIKVEEERKAREKKAAEEAEAARVQQIQGRIAFLFSTRPGRVFGKPAEAIHAALVDVQQQEIAEAVFAELTQAAIDAKELAEASLTDMYRKQRDQEAEAERQRTQAEENRRKQEELRKQQEDFEAQQRAHREQVARELAERQQAEEVERRARAKEALAQIQAEQKKLDDAKREEADRLAAIERKRLDDEAAEQRRIDDEKHRAEEQRRRDDRAAEEAAHRAAVDAAQKKPPRAAPMPPPCMGLSPWETPVELWQEEDRPRAKSMNVDPAAEKRYVRPRPPPGALHPRHGDRQAARRWACRSSSSRATSAMSTRAPVPVVRDRLRAALTGRWRSAARVQLDGEHINADAKSVTGFARKKWGEVDTEDVPIEYAAQFMHGLMITGRRLCLVAALRSFDDVDIFWTLRDDETIAAMRREARAVLVEHVLADVPPDPITFDDIKALFPLDNGLAAEATEEIAEKVEQLRDVKERIKVSRRPRPPSPSRSPSSSARMRGCASGRDIATWKAQNDTRLDQQALRGAHPEIFQQFTRTKAIRVLRFPSPRKASNEHRQPESRRDGPSRADPAREVLVVPRQAEAADGARAAEAHERRPHDAPGADGVQHEPRTCSSAARRASPRRS
jgi:hypothetical protein